MGTDGFALNNSFSPHFALGESNQVATMLLLVVMHIVVAVLGYLVRKPFGPISAIFELLHSSYYFTEGLLSTWLEYESKFCFFFRIFLLFPCNSRIIWISILLGFWRSFIDMFFFLCSKLFHLCLILLPTKIAEFVIMLVKHYIT